MNIAPFNVEVESLDGGVGAFSISGELDQSTAAKLRDPLHEAINSGTGAVMIDMTKCGFIDSTGLGVLIESRARMANKQGFLLVEPGLETRRALEISGLDRHFAVHDSLDEALSASL